MRLSVFAACSLATITFYGCASTLPPAQVGMDDAFAAGQVHTRRVLLLPADVEVGVFDENGHPAPQPVIEAASNGAAMLLHDGARMALAQRGYEVAGELSWDGNVLFPDGHLAQVLQAQEMQQLLEGLGGEKPPAPEVLGKLQSATGADALLQVSAGGQEVPGESTGEKVAKGVAIGLFIVFVVVALAIMSKGKSSAGAPRVAGGRPVHVATPARVIAGSPTPAMPVPVIGVWDGYYYGPPPEHPEASGLGVSMRLCDLRVPRVLWSADQFAEGPPRDPNFVRQLGRNVAHSLPTAR